MRKHMRPTDDVGGKLHLNGILLAVSPGQLIPTEGVLPHEHVFVVFCNLKHTAIKLNN